MKKNLLSTLFFLTCIISIQAQTLYGTTLTGGTHGTGTINKLMTAKNDFSVVYSPEGIDGRNPKYTHFVQAIDGKLYGMTAEGGAYNAGTIFSYDPSTAIFTKLKDFDLINGGVPYGSLVQASDGKLYGMTSAGGAGFGVIFSFDPSTLSYSKLRDFEINTGTNPQGDLIQGSDGKLYGMTPTGGMFFFNLGVVFSFDPLTLTYTVLKQFTGVDGARPNGSLVQLANGKLYGLTSSTYENFPFGDGGIFSLDPVTVIYTLLYNFETIPGRNPNGSLIQANDGKLYGSAQVDDASGKGLIFSFDPNTAVYTIEKENLGNSIGRLVQASDGKLYGLSFTDTTLSYAEIFSFDPFTSDYVNQYYFNYWDNSTGSKPLGSLIQATDGKLYGMNSDGGSTFYDNGNLKGAGIIFSFNPDSASFIKLKDFGANETGSNVTGTLLLANDGKFYGMTLSGGANGAGIIFSYDTLTSTYSKLKDFSDSDGVFPYGNLMQASNGKLYGMTSAGGVWGTIFSYDPVAAVYKKLKNFGSGDGAIPYGGLVEAADGKLYGMTKDGGTNNTGVIFSYDPVRARYLKLTDLFPATGIFPYGTLLVANDGKLYGLASSGGSGFGTIFFIDPLSSVFTKVMDFDGVNGSYPSGTLIQANDGKMYGTTEYGANNSPGAIFSFDPVTGTYTRLADFDRLNTGAFPTGTLLQASNGKLYGFTAEGGRNNLGVVFSFDITTGMISKIRDLDSSHGTTPSIGAGFTEVPECTTNLAYYKDEDGDGYGNPYNWKIALHKPEGYVKDKRDCDDRNKAIHPVTYYRDVDGDSFGDANASITICDPVTPAGYTKNKFDDDDRLKLAYKISNYPNPFKETSAIKYALPFESKVSITVYDLSGRPVATLVNNENKRAGFYTVNFNAGAFSSGMLYYKITAISKNQRFEETNKMVLLR